MAVSAKQQLRFWGIAFAILILVLIFKPTGLLGKNVREKV